MCFSLKYQSLNDNNSEEFHASFVLELCKPLPAAVDVVHKIYEVLNKAGKMSPHYFLPGEGHFLKNLMGVCGPFLKTLTLFKFLLFINSQKRLGYKENNTKYRSLS